MVWPAVGSRVGWGRGGIALTSDTGQEAGARIRRDPRLLRERHVFELQPLQAAPSRAESRFLRFFTAGALLGEVQKLSNSSNLCFHKQSAENTGDSIFRQHFHLRRRAGSTLRPEFFAGVFFVHAMTC